MSHVPYTNVVGSLMYAMVSTRLDISHVVGVIVDTWIIQVKSIGQQSNGRFGILEA
jgi:hypothetical protein